MNEEDWAKIEAVPIYTEKDLTNEFETFSTVLDGTSDSSLILLFSHIF